MTTRAQVDLPTIYRGDDWDVVFGINEKGGGLAGSDADGGGVTLANGDDQLVLPAGVMIRSGKRSPRGFNSKDIGKMVTLLTGSGITDGTTITDVALDGRSCTLSANATADRDADAIVVVRAKDLTDYTMTSDVRSSPDSTRLWAQTIATTRFAYGVISISIPSLARATNLSLPTTPTGKITDTLPLGTYQYDIQWVASNGKTSTPIVGRISVEPDRTHT